jgi:hypothetical protein
VHFRRPNLSFGGVVIQQSNCYVSRVKKGMDSKLAQIEKQYQRIFKHLNPADLTHQEDHWPDKNNLKYDSPSQAKELFLEFYSLEGLREALEQYGFLEQIRQKGLMDPKLYLNRDEDEYDFLSIKCINTPHPILELVVTIAPLPDSVSHLYSNSKSRFLYVKWLRMQNPLATPKPDRRLLPGQKYPGLGLGREMMVLLQLICARLDLDGVVEKPERFHNAALYFHRFRFLDPKMQGILLAILRDTRHTSLANLAWGVELKKLIDLETKNPFQWEWKEQILPRTKHIQDYFKNDKYIFEVKKHMENRHFRLSTGDYGLDLALAQQESIEIPDISYFPDK